MKSAMTWASFFKLDIVTPKNMANTKIPEENHKRLHEITV